MFHFLRKMSVDQTLMSLCVFLCLFERNIVSFSVFVFFSRDLCVFFFLRYTRGVCFFEKIRRIWNFLFARNRKFEKIFFKIFGFFDFASSDCLFFIRKTSTAFYENFCLFRKTSTRRLFLKSKFENSNNKIL